MTFDPESFLNETIDEPLATEYRLCPPGEYRAMIDDFTTEAFRTFEFIYKRGPNEGQPGTMTVFNCPFVILDEAVKASLGRERLIVEARITLDFLNGKLDTSPDRNVQLGRLRKAVGQEAAVPWGISRLKGAGPLIVKISHEQDRQDASRKYARVTSFAPIV